MAVNIGIATLDFGNAPVNETMASVVVTGQAGLVAATSKVEAYIMRVATADPNGHSADEHAAEDLHLTVGDLIDGTGFTIYGECRIGTTQGKFTVQWVWT